jgi:DNA-binding MarR family transcriptional regulator
MSRLSDSQLVILSAACQRPDRCVFPVKSKLKGNAVGNVLKSLLKKELIEEVRTKSRDDTVWRHDGQQGRMTLVATNAAFAALGIDPSDEAPDVEAEGADETPANVEAEPKPRPKAPKSKEPKVPRMDSKQAQLIAMLRRSKGATINEIAEALSWQPHTVRGAIAGALKKKLGLDVTSEKHEKRGRTYRIAG